MAWSDAARAAALEMRRRRAAGKPWRLRPKRGGPRAFSDALALDSPSGRMSKAALARAQERVRVQLFGKGGLRRASAAQPARRDALLRQAAELRGLAQRGLKPRAYLRRAAQLEDEAAKL